MSAPVLGGVPDNVCVVMMSAVGDAVHVLPVINAIKHGNREDIAIRHFEFSVTAHCPRIAAKSSEIILSAQLAVCRLVVKIEIR